MFGKSFSKKINFPSFAASPVMSESKKRYNAVLAGLKEQNLRLTPQRLAVIKILASSNLHPSVEDVYQQVKVDFPTTSLATVYKIVTLLEEIGEVVELGFVGGRNRYDGKRPYPHPHLICVKCKKIVDCHIPDADGFDERVSAETGYQIVNHRLEFYGFCPNCQQKQ